MKDSKMNVVNRNETVNYLGRIRWEENETPDENFVPIRGGHAYLSEKELFLPRKKLGENSVAIKDVIGTLLEFWGMLYIMMFVAGSLWIVKPEYGFGLFPPFLLAGIILVITNRILGRRGTSKKKKAQQLLGFLSRKDVISVDLDSYEPLDIKESSGLVYCRLVKDGCGEETRKYLLLSMSQEQFDAIVSAKNTLTDTFQNKPYLEQDKVLLLDGEND